MPMIVLPASAVLRAVDAAYQALKPGPNLVSEAWGRQEHQLQEVMAAASLAQKVGGINAAVGLEQETTALLARWLPCVKQN